MSEENQPRNAAAGSQQREHVREESSSIHREFSELGLTKRNEEFVYQLNKQLDAQGIKADKKPEAMQETIDALLEGQKTGTTAKQMFGTPTEKAKDLISGPKKLPGQRTSSFWLLALDNALMFFNIFTLLFGAMAIFSPKSMKVEQTGTTGITAIIIVGVVGGLLFAWITTLIQPQKGKTKQPLWYRILAIIAALIAWVLVYMVASLMPNVINPQLPGAAYIALGVLGFIAEMYFRRKFHIVGGAFGAPAQRK